MRLKSLIAAAAFLSFSFCAYADTIDSQTAGSLGTATTYFGQEFTSSGTYNNIHFSFYDNIPPTTIVASGTGFLLSQVYNGTPGALNSSTPGFLASATASGGSYVFNPTFTLSSGTYYFYENALITTSGGAAGEPAFFDTSGDFLPATVPGSSSDQSSNFIVTGTRLSAVPEPSSIALFGTGILGLAGAARRKFLRA